jgi:uncharacterized membrane protein YqjE
MRLFGTLAALAQDRVALAGTELREELARFELAILAGCAAILLASVALAVAAAVLIMAAGESRILVACIIAAVLAGGASYLAWWLRQQMARKPRAFSASLDELERDRLLLAGRSDERRLRLAASGEELVRLVSIGVLAYSIVRRLQRAP